MNVPTNLNNLKIKVDDLDVGKLKTVDLKTLSDVVDNEVIKNTKFNSQKVKESKNSQKAKVNNLEQKITDAATLIQINQYNTDKQKLKKEIENVDKKNKGHEWFSHCKCFEYKN